MVRLILASRGRITNPFGALNPPTAALRFHQGIDIGHGSGLDIFAPAAGDATRYDAGDRLGTYGKYWRIRHDDGSESLVAHLRQHIGANRRVAQGDVIGVMGNTGTIAVHCHQEYVVNGVRVDPTKYLAGAAGGDTSPFPEEDMPLYELIQTPDGTVWWCVDRVTRYGIPNETALAAYQYLLATRDLPTTILKQGNADAFGSPVFRNGAPATNIPAGSPAVFTDEQIAKVAADVEKRLQDEFASIPPQVVEELKKPGN